MGLDLAHLNRVQSGPAAPHYTRLVAAADASSPDSAAAEAKRAFEAEFMRDPDAIEQAFEVMTRAGVSAAASAGGAS